MEDSTPSSPPPEPPVPAMSPLGLAVCGAVTVLALFLTIGAATQLLNPAFGIWFTEIFIFVGVPWVLLRATQYEPLGYTGLEAPALAPAALGFGLGVTNFFAFVVPIQYAAQLVAPPWLREMFDGSRIFEGQNALELAVMLAGVSIAAPVCEEFFFRGVFQKGLQRTSLSRASAVLFTAGVFSAFHLDPVGFVARWELGVLFGALRLYTGSLWPSILAHSANNVVSAGLFLTMRQMGAENTEERPPLQAVLLLSTVGIAAMGSLLLLAQRFPALWGPRQEPPTLTQPSPSLPRLLLPWVVGATLCLGLLVLVDARGIRLRLVDMEHRLPKLPQDAPDALQAERTRLLQLREEARSGRMPMEAYEEERARQAQAHPPEKQ
ncbi:type II CAAX endopeptidase family protein [Hyalangium sp.]|uniref:type II CAAX endopeptidase family protein n=1 Tax=Hyalangium sp. TaxID=2028555 RepID=UPI002D2FD6C2|nr:type II CAAX endopeptidase family protein [Hyalangium sp.]HYH95989.1 type II CAAX endopeptidase family protein [Hyalangium sp.]